MQGRWLCLVVFAGCGSVDSKKPDAGSIDAPPEIDATVQTCAPVPAMIKARYRAENNANDHGSIFNGTAVGSNFAYTTGKHGMAFLFDGTDDVVTVANSEALWPTGSFTIEAWFKTTSTAGTRHIVRKYGCGNQCTTSNSFAYMAVFIDTSNELTFGFRGDDNTAAFSRVVATGANVTDGAWHHVVGVRDVAASSGSLYLDGALAATTTPPAIDLAAMTNKDNDDDFLTIGGGVSAGATTYEGFLAGAIDEVAVYHSALTAAQVTAIYTAPDGKCL